MVSASWVLRKSSNCSACEPRAPRWTSEINKVRKRRSGLSSLKESLPIPVHLTDSCDRAMTTDAADGPTRINDAPPANANSSAMRQGSDDSEEMEFHGPSILAVIASAAKQSIV